MKRNTTTFALASLTAIIVMAVGCRKKEQHINIQQHYYANFSDGMTSGGANFTTSESTPRPVIIGNEAKIKINGLAIGPNFLSSSNPYVIMLDSASDVTFTLELKDKTLTNSVSRSAMTNSEIIVDSVISGDDTISISWTGNPVQAGEAMNFVINQQYDSSASAYYGTSSGQLVGETFIFDYTQTRSFPPGIYIVRMMRQKTFPLQQSDNGAGGEISVNVITEKTIVIQ